MGRRARGRARWVGGCATDVAAVGGSDVSRQHRPSYVSTTLYDFQRHSCDRRLHRDICPPPRHGGWLVGSRVVSVVRALVQIAAATLSGNSLRQTVHTHCASVHRTAKLVAALLRVAGVTVGLTESNGSLPPGM